jgi:antirestriction protein ArdC
MKTTMEKKDVYGIINSTILEKLQQNILPWKQCWNTFGPARNYVSNKPYKGINAVLLNHTQSDYPLFLTFNQVKELGGHIKKGSKGHIVVFWKKLYYGNEGQINVRKVRDYSPEDVKTIPLLRYYYVFNIDCTEGIEFKLPEKNLSLHPVETCERIIEEMPNAPVIEHGGDQPRYHPYSDSVKIPHLANFKSEEEYYASIFHELAHSTGHASRLNRESLTSLAETQRCFEELIAETAACFLCNEAGIADKVIDNSAAYIKGWLEKLTRILKEDDKFFIKASAQAQKAANYILNLKEEAETEDKPELVLEEKGV